MSKKKQTVEQKAGETILQTGAGWYDVGGRRYAVGKPSVATVIMVSELISSLPLPEEGVSLMGFVLGRGKDMRVLGKIGAVLILGAKAVREGSGGWFSRWRRPPVERLSDSLLEEWSPGELLQLVTDRLGQLDLGSFFALTTSLGSANVLRRTGD